jgi:hypothetical protein
VPTLMKTNIGLFEKRLMKIKIELINIVIKQQ